MVDGALKTSATDGPGYGFAGMYHGAIGKLQAEIPGIVEQVPPFE
jgi:hypothetical protein